MSWGGAERHRECIRRSAEVRQAQAAVGAEFARAWPERVRRWLSGEDKTDCPHVQAFVAAFGEAADA